LGSRNCDIPSLRGMGLGPTKKCSELSGILGTGNDFLNQFYTRKENKQNPLRKRFRQNYEGITEHYCGPQRKHGRALNGQETVRGNSVKSCMITPKKGNDQRDSKSL